MPKLLLAFQQYFREHAEAWIERFSYKEARPQRLLQAFLQRIVNGGGQITREYGLGRRHTDLFIEWPTDEQVEFGGEVQRILLELKIRHDALESIMQRGLAQIIDYADQCAADELHLLIFNWRSDIAWKKKIWQRIEQVADRQAWDGVCDLSSFANIGLSSERGRTGDLGAGIPRPGNDCHSRCCHCRYGGAEHLCRDAGGGA